MPNNIAFARNYVGILDEVYQRAGVSNILNSGKRMVRAGRGAKEILIPKIEVTGLGNYVRNVGYKTGGITYEFETKVFNFLPNSGELIAVYRLRSVGGVPDVGAASLRTLHRRRQAIDPLH